MKKWYLLFLFIPTIIVAQSYRIITEQQVMNDFLNKEVEELEFQSPIILSNSILFFYRGPAKTVSLLGSFNQWQKEYPMEQSRSNLWVLRYQERLPSGAYQYRLKIDGFLIADPMNPNYELGSGNQKLSIFNLTNEFISNKKYPFWVSNNTYLFRYQNTAANVVTIAGDFNNWNPFSHQMSYKGAGYFEIELELDPKKIYLYSFIMDGVWHFDPNNKKQYRNSQDRPISGFYADQDASIP